MQSLPIMRGWRQLGGCVQSLPMREWRQRGGSWEDACNHCVSMRVGGCGVCRCELFGGAIWGRYFGVLFGGAIWGRYLLFGCAIWGCAIWGAPGAVVRRAYHL